MPFPTPDNVSTDADVIMGAFAHWLSDQNVREPFCYWRGLLMANSIRMERIGEGRGGCKLIPTRAGILRKIVWDTYERGKITLTQKKLGENIYDYWAVKAS